MRAAASSSGQIFQAFPLGGAARELVVDGVWRDLIVPGPDELAVDLVMLRIPDETRRVVVIASSEALSGTAASADQAAASFPLDAGTWTFCTDRAASGPRFYLAIDPRDTTPGVAETATVSILEAAR